MSGAVNVDCNFQMSIRLTKIQEAILSDNPLQSLEELVYFFSSQGLTRQDIYNWFLQYHNTNQDSEDWKVVENKFNGEHPVDLTLDRLLGWCHKDHIFLGDEPIQT